MPEHFDSLHLIGLRLPCRLGVSAAERRRSQIIRADIELTGNWHDAGVWDRLDKTFDYSALAAELRKAVAGREFRLLESVAEIIAAACLIEPRVKSVKVQASKKAPAAVKGLDRFAVCIQRRRSLRTDCKNYGQPTK